MITAVRIRPRESQIASGDFFLREIGVSGSLELFDALDCTPEDSSAIRDERWWQIRMDARINATTNQKMSKYPIPTKRELENSKFLSKKKNMK